MKTIILGNAGSGKSTMAKKIMARSSDSIARLALDDVAWDDGPQRKPVTDSAKLLINFIGSHEHWIIEGCYADLVELALPYCTELRFLNPGTAACLDHCRKRAWEGDKFATAEEQNAMLPQLLDWVASYENRTDEYGLLRHRAVFDSFAGPKRECISTTDYDD